MIASLKVWPILGCVARIRLGDAIVITWCTIAWCSITLWSCGFAQELAEIESENTPSLSIVALQEIQKDYNDFLAERKRLHDEYEHVLDTLSNTEVDLQKISSDGIRQQLMAMQSSMLSMRLGARIIAISSENTVRTSEEMRFGDRLLNRTKTIADLNTSMRGEELRQLDAAAQATARRRIECLQTGFQLQQEWLEWQQEWPQFMERYWPHSDPERRFTREEVESRLAILENADPEDFGAVITSALLLDRLGKNDEAITAIDQVLQAQTALQTTAMIAKAAILFSQNKEDAANAMLIAATQSRNATPHDRWLWARLAASQKQFVEAEKKWNSLVSVKSLEIESRRGLALLYCERAERVPAMSKRALKEARLAFDLEPRPDWFAHFVLSLALHKNGETAEAIKQLEQARDKASDENQALCDSLLESMQDKKRFAWDFRNTLP